MNQTIYPIGIQDFEKIRKNGYLYIDKTVLIYQLVKIESFYSSRMALPRKRCARLRRYSMRFPLRVILGKFSRLA